MLYSNELPFGILSSNSFLNIETMNAISFCYDKNYYDFISVIEENSYYEKNIKYWITTKLIKDTINPLQLFVG